MTVFCGSGGEALVELAEEGRADRVGSGEAAGFNINVPLHSEAGLGDADYMQVTDCFYYLLQSAS